MLLHAKETRACWYYLARSGSLHTMKHESTDLGVLLGENVRTLRERHGLTQQGLAEAVSLELGTEIKSITVLRIEKGQRPTSVDELGALAAVLEVLPEHLISLGGAELGRRAELASLLKEAMIGHLSAVAAVSNFEEAQGRLRSWCRSHEPELGSAGAGGTRPGRETSWLDRNRIRTVLQVKFEESSQEVDI